MRNKAGNFCMLLGAALVIAALLLFCMNEREAKRADSDAQALLSGVVEQIGSRSRQLASAGLTSPLQLPGDVPAQTPAPGEIIAPDASLAPVATPGQGGFSVDGEIIGQNSVAPGGEGVFVDPYDTEMTVVSVDGNDYIGYVSIPELGVELPVMSDWSYPKLRKAPCRYFGSTKTDDLVILAHNYARHFGGLKDLSPGDEVLFTDMNGVVSRYSVMEVDTMSAYSVDEVTSGEYDLTLFTCTYGGRSRVVVFCEN